MDEFELDKPPRGLAGDELHKWYVDKANQAAKDHYETKLYEQREARRKAEQARDDAKGKADELQKQVPGEGDVVLKGDDAKRWGELKELDLVDLKTRAETGDKLAEEKRLSGVTKDLGLNAETFFEFVHDKRLSIETEPQDDGPAKHVVVLKGDDGKDKRVDLMEHLQTAYAAWLPALSASQDPQPMFASAVHTPPAGRLPTHGGPRRPADAQDAYLQQRKEEGASSVNVLAQKFQGGTKQNGSGH